MRINFFRDAIPATFLQIGLVAVLLAGCAPSAATNVPEQAAVQPSQTASSTSIAEDSSVPLTPRATEAVISPPMPVVTSRGPELHATDPTTVSLASGRLQLVEFFRFT